MMGPPGQMGSPEAVTLSGNERARASEPRAAVEPASLAVRLPPDRLPRGHPVRRQRSGRHPPALAETPPHRRHHRDCLTALPLTGLTILTSSRSLRAGLSPTRSEVRCLRHRRGTCRRPSPTAMMTLCSARSAADRSGPPPTPVPARPPSSEIGAEPDPRRARVTGAPSRRGRPGAVPV